MIEEHKKEMKKSRDIFFHIQKGAPASYALSKQKRNIKQTADKQGMIIGSFALNDNRIN